MNYFNHAKHTLSQLQAFLHDAMNEENLSAEEIYDVIIENIASDVEHYQMQYEKSKKLFNLLKGYEKPDAESEEEPEDYDYEIPPQKETKVKSWVLPVDDEGVIILPEDLLERTGWKEGDTLVYEISDGGVIVRKKEPLSDDEMIAAGYTMTDDGFWIMNMDAC
jgi:bifunctional DNA-binding transcriptional regulator/antitoxin component of YhaV-PrlF toxin-antitoxin module